MQAAAVDCYVIRDVCFSILILVIAEDDFFCFSEPADIWLEFWGSVTPTEVINSNTTAAIS